MVIGKMAYNIFWSVSRYNNRGHTNPILIKIKSEGVILAVRNRVAG